MKFPPIFLHLFLARFFCLEKQGGYFFVEFFRFFFFLGGFGEGGRKIGIEMVYEMVVDSLLLVLGGWLWGCDSGKR